MKTNFKVVIFFILISCHNSHEQNVNLVENTTIETTIPETKPIDWSNPVLIGTASFGNIINVNFKIGNFSELYRLTNSSLKTNLSRDEIIEIYKGLPLGFDLKFPINKTLESNTIWLHYSCTINATKKILRFPIVVEDDTCRLLLMRFQSELEKITQY